jgi:hypothetical protein
MLKTVLIWDRLPKGPFTKGTFPWRWGGSSTRAWMPTYVSILRIPQMIWVWRATVEWYWQGKIKKTQRKTCPTATLSTTNPTWINPGANPGLHGERPATNNQSHGTACGVPLLLHELQGPHIFFFENATNSER